MVGTLVVCLPARFHGGTLLVSHHGAQRTFDWAREIGDQAEDERLHWAAFFGDVDHAIGGGRGERRKAHPELQIAKERARAPDRTPDESLAGGDLIVFRQGGAVKRQADERSQGGSFLRLGRAGWPDHGWWPSIALFKRASPSIVTESPHWRTQARDS